MIIASPTSLRPLVRQLGSDGARLAEYPSEPAQAMAKQIHPLCPSSPGLTAPVDYPETH